MSVPGDGEYAATVRRTGLVADDGGSRHLTERALIRGARLAVCEETGEGEALNAKRVKNLTGGNRIVARGLYQNDYNFAPTHTLVLATNHLPVVKVNDHATWRRLRAVTFPNTFWTEADRLAKPDGIPRRPPGRRRAARSCPSPARW